MVQKWGAMCDSAKALSKLSLAVSYGVALYVYIYDPLRSADCTHTPRIYVRMCPQWGATTWAQAGREGRGCAFAGRQARSAATACSTAIPSPPHPLPLHLTPQAPSPRQACRLLRLRRPAARPAAHRAAMHRAARQRGVPGTLHVHCTACAARMRCTHALHRRCMSTACALHVALHEHCPCTALRLHCACTAPALRLHQAWLSGVPAARVEA